MMQTRRHNRILVMSISLLSLIIVYALAGCSDHRYYADSEEALDTSGYYDLLDHIAAYYPNGVSLNFPGYIVGFEESDRSKVTSSRDDVLLDESVYSAGYTVERLVKALRYNVPYISQVMHYQGRPYGEGNCALYNLYHNHGTTVASACSNDSLEIDIEHFDYSDTFTNSWDAIDVLQQRLAADVASKQYTHLIVAVMGLDTAQEEAIRNYKSIVSSIRKDAGDSFKPLFVGITWPSFFANRWFDPLWEVLAYHPVADRADILGLTWLGVLLNDVILPLGDSIEISVIAHSFGARASTIGLCVGPAIRRNDEHRAERQPLVKIENFIGLAPAFSLTRFTEEEHLFYENIYYKDHCPMIERFVFTASDNDGAFGAVFWSDAVGDYNFMKRYCDRDHPVSVVCHAASADGNIDGFDAAAKISYIDTTLLMKHSMPGTSSGGAGHSDIYRPEIGRLLWNVINGSKN
ncbi:MAG: alpha/beta hydrolase [Gammaproteobacteria bacterium]|nr:alpha/beta hydrolase [Gammaproteobacteria bacterium]NNJ48892.1 alpha/beta hydrolase [Gammaproteobacteria bacterium]